MSSRARKYGYTTLTLTDTDTAEEFRELRDQTSDNTVEFIERLLRLYREHEA